ncbi:hypothetical protein FHU38_000815 [Saccharomonospora amisosensis]|uniref:Uncharacterized protein n=1 Tax=Saccharomonospora amisosensis TaxID=1128677 RepID=A0A7X5UM02_9PSEU|nr:hypothetical protein [Saccharomonospora amisosensis]
MSIASRHAHRAGGAYSPAARRYGS